MSFVAARPNRCTSRATCSTSRSGNLRSSLAPRPALTCSAAAVELGLGAGGLGPDRRDGRRTPQPGRSLRALGEAIDVIRGIWDKGNHERLVVDGTHHRVNGAKRGPAPAHDVAIWVGGLKPRMLRLIGEKADGWLPSLAY